MRGSNGWMNRRALRSLGLILALGMPLAVISPLSSGPQVDSGLQVGSTPRATEPNSIAASSAPQAGAAAAQGVGAGEGLQAYEPATPATPLASPSVQVEQTAASPGVGVITKTVNDPRCGPGATSVTLLSGGISCFHNGLDVPSPILQPAAQAPKTAPVCMGNGVNGPRIQLIYMYVDGQPNRIAQVGPRILNEIVPRMEGTFRQTSKSQGREIGMRLHMPGCKPNIEAVKISKDLGEPDDPFVMASRLSQGLTDAGYGSTDRKFHIWFDGGNGKVEDGRLVLSACGIAPAYAAALEQGLNPTPANTSNVGWHRVMPVGEAAITFRFGVPILGEPPAQFGRQTSECWGRGAMGAHTEMHELLHLLGAVGMSAPNSNGADAHCLDDVDIMCQVGANGKPKFIRCNTRLEQLDCGSDDYFNARPQAGSYLSRAWNIANSRFLGPALVHDAVPVEIPRP